MGYARPKPERLAEKLRQIRLALGLSQTEMLRHLGADELITYNRISDFEIGKREPPLTVLLQYARAARVNIEALIDDELDLPDRLPGTVNHDQISRPYTRNRKSR